MAILDINQFLEAISQDRPCGENLEYDPDFSQLEQAAQGSPERQIGDSIIAAEDPDWKIVQNLSLQLLERTRDIQVCVCLTRAWTHIHGFEGLDQGLTLIHGLLEQHWESVYPQQDSDEDYPMLRINTLATLNDFISVLKSVQKLPLTESRGLGHFSWYHLQVAEGRLSASANETETPDTALIQAAFQDTDIDTLQAKFQSIEHALTQVQAIDQLTLDKVGSEYSSDLSALSSLLDHIYRDINDAIQQHPGTALIHNETALNGNVTSEDTDHNTAQTAAPVPQTGIHSREEVARSISLICNYFDQYEPSSPIPFLLKRAHRLLAMDFIEIMQDLAPEGVKQAETICGPKDNNET